MIEKIKQAIINFFKKYGKLLIIPTISLLGFFFNKKSSKLKKEIREDKKEIKKETKEIDSLNKDLQREVKEIEKTEDEILKECNDLENTIEKAREAQENRKKYLETMLGE